jgi:hypothetical protein
LPAAADTELHAGARPDAEQLAAGGGLMAIRREQGLHSLYGVRGTLKTKATHLSTELVLMGTWSTLRDFARGACLEDAARFPKQRTERFELDAERNALRIRREESSGSSSLELLLIGAHGTRVALRERPGAPRPSCPLAPGAGQPIIELSNAAGVELQFIALASEDAAAPGAPPASVR